MFYTPEEKLVLLRKKYKITQKELSEGGVSRPFLGMIETGSKNLTEKTAHILCHNFNKILSQRNIDESVDPKELMKSKGIQSKEYLDSAIKNKEFNFFNIDLALYNISAFERLEFFYKIIEILKEQKNLKMAKAYLKRAIIEEEREKNLKYLILELMRINYFINAFGDSIEMYLNFHEKINLELDETAERINYNYCYALYKINNIGMARKELEALIEKLRNQDIIFKTKSLLAFILHKNYSDYLKAAQLYKSLYRIAKKSNNKEQLIITLANLLRLGLDEDSDSKPLKINFQKLENLEGEFDSVIIKETQVKILTTMGKACLKLKDFDKVKKYYSKAIEKSSLVKNFKKTTNRLISDFIFLLDGHDLELAEKLERDYIIPFADSENALNLLYFYEKNFALEKHRNLLNKMVDIFQKRKEET